MLPTYRFISDPYVFPNLYVNVYVYVHRDSNWIQSSRMINQSIMLPTYRFKIQFLCISESLCECVCVCT